ncbi:MAG: outer membrane lipoprotein-sorting protein [Acidobacteriota bacterium]|nr:outer membrane lipoprotein-sorting protein [Acidobacteriota bacterium]
MLRSIIASTVFCALLIGCSYASTALVAIAREDAQTISQTQSAQSAADSKTPQKPAKVEKIDKNQKNFTAEQIAESVVYVYGSRPILEQIRRNGVERGRVCRPTCDTTGKTEEASYERRFVRGENFEQDKVRLDQKMPTIEYSLIYGGGRLFGIINGSTFIPRQDAADTFMSQHRHSIDTLLRYKENGSTLTLVGKDKQKGLDLYIVDLVDKDKQATRYYISVKSLHVLWLEYEAPSIVSAAPAKYARKFFDYRYAQGTLVPYKSLLLEDGKQIQETRILTVTYGIKLDDSLFKSPEA